MKTLFQKVKDITEFHRLQIKRLFLETFCDNLDKIEPGTLDSEIGFIDDAISVIIPTKGKRKLVAMAFLLLPTQNDYENKDRSIYRTNIENIINQGVRADKDAYLYNFCVREQDRRKGYATKLLGDIEKKVIDEGRERVVLFVDADNEAAVALYNKRGYNVILAAPDGFVMEKKLI